MNLKNWTVARIDKDGKVMLQNGWLKASVPGSVHYDLIDANLLKNPFASTKNAFEAEWVAQSDWLFKFEFDVSDAELSKNIFILKLNGVDTFSDIYLNDEFIGKTANAYKIYEFNISKQLLKKSGNILRVHIKTHASMIADKMHYAKRLRVGDKTEGLFGKSMIRRYQRSFFSGSSLLNLGTGVLGIGIYRPVELLCYHDNYIVDYHFSTISIAEDKKSATCELALDLYDADTGSVFVEIMDKDGNAVFQKNVSAQEAKALRIELNNPKLWYPRGYGEAYLYSLKISLSAKDKVTSVIDTKIGIKAVTLLLKEKDGQRDAFGFIVNGDPVIIHGQNHIPIDYIKVYRDEAAYDNLFALFENQNVNLVRMWGGGVIEQPSFYNRCDESGIMIWQDMFLHSNVYPDFDEDWKKDFLEECEGIIGQVRNRASLGLICGGNEQYEAWDEWGWKRQMDYFFGGQMSVNELPEISKRLCPEIPYIINSPHDGLTSQSPVVGESHIWGNFYNSTKDPTFVSETCWTQESYSRPETLKKIMDLDVDEFIGQTWNEKWKERTSLPFLNRMPFTNWFDPYTLRGYLHGLEIEQMRADYSALSKFRYESPSNRGIIYWSMNKGGPLFQFGCVDYDLYPMMPYYAVKNIYAPIGVYPYRDVSDICVMLSNQSAAKENISVEAIHYAADGSIKFTKTTEEAIAPGELKRVLRLEGLYDTVADRLRECFYVHAIQNGEVVFSDMLYFCPFGEFEQRLDGFRADVAKISDGEYEAAMNAPYPVRCVEIESDKKILCSDNYFPLAGTKTVKIKVMDHDLGEASIKVKILENPDVIK